MLELFLCSDYRLIVCVFSFSLSVSLREIVSQVKASFSLGCGTRDMKEGFITDIMFPQPEGPSPMFSELQDAEFGEQLPCGVLDEFSTPQCLKANSPVKSGLPAADDQHLKVYLRVRPFLKAEVANNECKDCVIIEDSETLVLEAPKHSSTMKNSERGIGQAVHKFTFSQIFGQETSQKELFDGTVKNLVEQYLEGQNGLVFTYGVTNAGKTYTIQGTAKDAGILPRALGMLFDHVEGRQYRKMDLKPHIGGEVLKLDRYQTWQEETIKAAVFSMLREETEYRPLKMPISKSSQKDLAQPSSITPAVPVASNHLASNAGLADQRPLKYSVWVSFCEIYNEYVYDLLDAIPTLKSQKRQNLRVCEDQKGNSYVKDLKWINITCLDEAFKFLKIGNKNRSLACTKINQQSSRRLSLCDLAGSERCDKAESFGDRLKEAGNINTSLLILGKCISALRQKQQNKLKSIIVPFRESKLTRLFQAFFCGKGKACMIVNINQCASIYDETLHVLKFSAIAKQIVQIIRPKVDLQPFDPMKGSDASMMVCTDLSETLSAENLFSKGEEEQENEELDAATLGYEELLALMENLKQKLVAERQHKMVLEIWVRKEMGEAMFNQLLRTEEVWSERFEELKEIYEEQLESKLHMYKESIRRHAYKCALVDVQEKYLAKDEFASVRHKVKVAALNEELETMFDENQSKPAAAAHSDELLEELAWFKEEVSKKESQLQSLQLEAAINGNEVNQYKELYGNKVLSEERSARLLEEKDKVTTNLMREMKEMHIALQQAEKNCQERNEEVKKLNRKIMMQEKMLKEIKEQHVDQIQQLQNVVSKLQEELALSTKPPRAEKPVQTAKRLFANLTGSKLAAGSPSKNSLFKSRELTPRIKVKKNIVSGKLPSIPSKTNE
ncbi:kinesin-like protein KIF20A isoform X2 [Scyliorhinus canicula]|uniref:kinesin-like protein KIF20A isoform X2 n=1 Tax=Scyliorhinus canicula TaxID=7830 RepID=UPI0018F338FF|nr:kinesin-like protein KIF20A isoform X2 [Scyliorhinus canicula]